MPSTERKSLTKETLKIYWQYARVYWRWLIVCAIGMITLISCDLILPFIYKKLFDLLTFYMSHKSDPHMMETIHSTIWTIVGVGIVGSWTGWRICMYAVSNFESRVMADLSNYCFEYLHKHSYKFFTDNFAGSLVKRVNRFSAGFEIIGDQCTIQLGQVILRIIPIIVILFWRNTKLGSVFIVWTITFTIFNIVWSKFKLKIDLYRAEMDTKVTARLSDTISNNINLKLFAGVDREIDDFKVLIEEHRRARYKSWITGEWSMSIQGFAVRILEGVVIWKATDYWLPGYLTVGDFILLRSYLYQLVDRVQEVGQSIRKIYESMADANEMTEILLTPHEIQDAPSEELLNVTEGKITFQNVSFCYSGNTNCVLNNFNLQTTHGERIGVVGPSGGGKSTILKLVARLYDVTSGNIFIDDQDITQVTQSSLHRNIAYVPQESILFHRTLMENIRYSRPHATNEEVIHASRLAHCHEFISKFPLGYNTLVGERGIKLSGGERQRVAIARAILMDAPILILDEATSSLDSESEMYIQDSLSKLMIGRTVIAVAHRLSTIRKMDRIIVIKDGEIIEEGNHNILMEIENGVYQKLWNLQSLDEEHSHIEYLP